MILVVQSMWNEAVTSRLVAGVESVLKEHELPFKLVQAPGALEVPFLIQWHAKKLKNKLWGAVACGTVIKGDTYHFEVVANESARALTDLSMRLSLPIANAILCCYNLNQALERTDGKHGHKGEEAAHALLQVLELTKGKRFAVRKRRSLGHS